MQTPTLIQIITEAFRDHSIYSPPYLAERHASIVGCHIANVANMVALDNGNGGIRKHGRPLNMRQHLMFVCPSGFGKSTYFRSMFSDVTGMFYSDELPTTVAATFSKESWMGTITKIDGAFQLCGGIFEEYKHGIVAADEYARLVVLMDGDGVEHDEVYLMTALDTDRASKTLSSGKIEIDGIATTILAGLRIPTKPLRMTSGLSRRFSIEIFLPSPLDAIEIKARSRISLTPDQKMEIYHDEAMAVSHDLLDELSHNFPTELDFEEVNSWCDLTDIPHFQEETFRRLALGYAVASGTFPHITMSPIVKSLCQSELINRQVLKDNALTRVPTSVIKGYSQLTGCTFTWQGKEHPAMPRENFTSFLTSYYQLNNGEIRQAIGGAKRRSEVGTEKGFYILLG